MKVILSDGTVNDALEKREAKSKRLQELWESNEARGIPNPMKANHSGVKSLIRKKRK